MSTPSTVKINVVKQRGKYESPHVDTVALQSTNKEEGEMRREGGRRRGRGRFPPEHSEEQDDRTVLTVKTADCRFQCSPENPPPIIN